MHEIGPKRGRGSAAHEVGYLPRPPSRGNRRELDSRCASSAALRSSASMRSLAVNAVSVNDGVRVKVWPRSRSETLPKRICELADAVASKKNSPAKDRSFTV